MNYRLVLLILAVVSFTLAALGADVLEDVNEAALGLAFFAGAHI